MDTWTDRHSLMMSSRVHVNVHNKNSHEVYNFNSDTELTKPVPFSFSASGSALASSPCLGFALFFHRLDLLMTLILDSPFPAPSSTDFILSSATKSFSFRTLIHLLFLLTIYHHLREQNTGTDLLNPVKLQNQEFSSK